VSQRWLEKKKKMGEAFFEPKVTGERGMRENGGKRSVIWGVQRGNGKTQSLLDWPALSGETSRGVHQMVGHEEETGRRAQKKMTRDQRKPAAAAELWAKTNSQTARVTANEKKNKPKQKKRDQKKSKAGN